VITVTKNNTPEGSRCLNCGGSNPFWLIKVDSPQLRIDLPVCQICLPIVGMSYVVSAAPKGIQLKAEQQPEPPAVDDAVLGFITNETGWELDGERHRDLVIAVSAYQKGQNAARPGADHRGSITAASDFVNKHLLAHMSQKTFGALVKLFALYERWATQ
jgi:hypothetical protein